ncbi:peptidoglycan-binding domain-containing protein [Nocardiopsis sp. CA-288880]|uniref:peptidoglycan-binding domain-containing protein n=1 Tax=Nocardiopsis sp. CA-288880 TaxID=3239995 RepID=UPI003D980615
MSWRLARSLEQLRGEVNATAPRRSKRSDGSIGDAAHSRTASDHNPNSAGVVCAIDITHDPAGGADMNQLAERLRTGGHPALKYLIWNRRIWSRTRAGEGWRSYGGSNPHSSHMHVSVGVGSDGRSTGPYDNTSSWGISSTHTMEDDLLGLKIGDKGDGVKAVQELARLAGRGSALGEAGVDGEYGRGTAEAVRLCRKDVGSKAAKGYGDTITGHALAQLIAAVARKQGGK